MEDRPLLLVDVLSHVLANINFSSTFELIRTFKSFLGTRVCNTFPQSFSRRSNFCFPYPVYICELSPFKAGYGLYN